MFARSAVHRAAAHCKTSLRRYASGPIADDPSMITKNLSTTATVAIVSVGVVAISAGVAYSFPEYFKAILQPPQRPVVAPAIAAKAFTGGDQPFLSLLLEDVTIVNHNTKQFRFKLPEDTMTSGLETASALLTKFQGPGMEKPVIRPYTPVSKQGAQGFIELLVKKYAGGPMSTHMHDMQPGQRLDFKGPIPKYPWLPNKHEHIALLAGGTGITPMFQLTQAVLDNPDDRTQITLVFGNVSEEDILLRRQLADFENTYPQRFRAFYTLSKPSEAFPSAPAHITPELLKTVLPEPTTGGNFKVFVCGPPGMMKALSGPKKSPQDQGELEGMLKDLGYSKDQVYKF